MEPEIQPARESNALIWIGRVLSALPVLMMVTTAVMGLMKPTMVEDGMKHLGYPERIGLSLTIVELACVLLYLIPQTAVLGAILLTGYLGGATASHIRISEPFHMPVIVGVVVWLGLYLRDARLRDLLPVRKSVNK
jgi:hypothetical protein